MQILGSNLDDVQSVSLGDVSATFTNRAGRLTFTVPSGASSGPVTVRTPAAKATSPGIFIVMAADPLSAWSWQGRWPDNFNGITWGDGLFVAVASRIFTSSDGLTWTPHNPAPNDDWLAVTYGAGLFVAVGRSGQIVTSPDGVVWTNRAAGLFPSSQPPALHKVVWNQNGFVAVGAGGTILHSANGMSWTKANSGLSEDLIALAAGASLYVAAPNITLRQTSNILLVWSQDGLVWEPAVIDQPYGFLSALTFGDGLFVGVGNGFTITSTDGKFEKGDVVSIHDKNQVEFARGLAKVGSIQIRSASGVVIHRDDMVIL